MSDLSNKVAQIAVDRFSKRLARLNQRTKNILTDYFDNPDQTHKTLAERYGVSIARVGKVLRSDVALFLFKDLASRKVQSLTPKSAQVLSNLLKTWKEQPETARKVAEKVLTETKVINAPTLIVKNQFEALSHEDLKRYVHQADKLPEPVIEGEIVENDDPSV